MANLTNSAKLIEKVEGLNVTAVGATAPSSPSEGDIWYDTTNDVLKAYDGTNWNEVGSDAADINTKMFKHIGSNGFSNAEIQEAVDYVITSGKLPILVRDVPYLEYIAFLPTEWIRDGNDRYIEWESAGTYSHEMMEGYHYLTKNIIQANLNSSNQVTSVNHSSKPIGSYLDADYDYYIPYTPQYPGSPATKKYVDDSVSSVVVPTKVSDLTNDSNFQTDTQVSQSIAAAVASAYKYKGSVANQAALPASGNTAGDVWNTEDTGMNFAWTGSAWDPLGATVDLSNYLAKNNTTSFTPSGDYNPATKKYVDDNINGINYPVTSINGLVGDVTIRLPEMPVAEGRYDYIYLTEENINNPLIPYNRGMAGNGIKIKFKLNEGYNGRNWIFSNSDHGFTDGRLIYEENGTLYIRGIPRDGWSANNRFDDTVILYSTAITKGEIHELIVISHDSMYDDNYVELDGTSGYLDTSMGSIGSSIHGACLGINVTSMPNRQEISSFVGEIYEFDGNYGYNGYTELTYDAYKPYYDPTLGFILNAENGRSGKYISSNRVRKGSSKLMLGSDAIDDTAFGSSWDGDTTHAPSKNAVYDAIGNIETLLAAL